MGTAQTLRPQVFVIPVHGEVEPAMAAFIQRATREAAQVPGSVIVLELDTFGGRVDAALAMVDTMVNLGPHRTIAWVKSKAISAGALIALACNDLVMAPSTTIGDCAPITYSGNGPEMLGEKFQSPLRAQFRSLARRNHYPPTLAAAMVSADQELLTVTMDNESRTLTSNEYQELPQTDKARITGKKRVVAKGQLLTMDDTEALELGFSRLTAATVAEMLPGLGIQGAAITRLEQNWSETMARVIARLAPLLLVIGAAAVYVEIQIPGFGLPGVVGIITLGLVFINQYLVGMANATELLFAALGVALLAMEIFVLPGFGAAGLGGLICIAIGMVLSFQDFVIPDPALPWQGALLTANVIQVLMAMVIALCLALLLLRYLFPRLGRVVDGPYLHTTLAASHADSVEAKGVSTGACGTALTLLRPAGKVAIGSDIIDATSVGEFLEKDTPVVVTEIRGNRVIVSRRAP
jgi:membrane-bound serine protease (ClpP class)